MRRGAVYYSDSSLPDEILKPCLAQLRRCLEAHDIPIVSVTHQPLDLGRNIVFRGPRGTESMFRQILDGLENIDADLVFLIEHDVLYHPSHFAIDFPSASYWDNCFWYNRNQWHVSSTTGKAVFFQHDDPSQLVARRDLLLTHYRRVVAKIAFEDYHSAWGFSPPKGLPKEERWGETGCWFSRVPNIDIRHPGCLTRSQWSPGDFRNSAGCKDFKEADEVPGWGKTFWRFGTFLQEIANAPA